jgi:hypothetical protein
MATQLSSLKITNVTRQIKTDTNEFRRTKLVKKLEEQISLATAQKNGELFTVKRLKNVKDEASGTTSQIEVSKRINAWYWTDNNKTYLQIKYGTKVLCLQGKDKNTIECASRDDLIKTLFLVRTIVTNGELDSVIEAASVKVRERFGK